MGWWRSRDWAGLFLKPACPLCGRPATEVFCVDCDRQVAACRLPSPIMSIPLAPRPGWLFAWGDYGGPLKRAIAACKYKHHPEIARYLGQQMGDAWIESRLATRLPGNVAIVPIPLHADRLRQRGFNQAAELAKGFGDRARLPCLPQLLQRLKATKPQIETTSRAEREQNLRDAFCAQRASQRPVLLLDDIYTTGTTIRAAIAALTSARIPVVGVVILARTRSG